MNTIYTLKHILATIIYNLIQENLYGNTIPVVLNCLFDVSFMHQSIPAVPIPPPGQPRGICSRCQSRGWDIRNFIAARGLGICVPRGDPRAFDTHVFESAMDEFSGKDEAFVEQWL